MILPGNKLSNVRRRADRVKGPGWITPVTCPASRHVLLMADLLARGKVPVMFSDDPEHCAGSLYAVLESLWKLRKSQKR